MENITPSPTQAPKEIEYTLPYPGILPNNPLFIAKTIRDRLQEVFTLNPLRKAEFYLLQADKKLSSSLILFGLGKEDMAEKMLSKSQDYLEKAIDGEETAKNSSESLLELSGKIKQSSKKQSELINGLYEKSKAEIKLKLKEDLEQSKILQKRADQFVP